MNFWLTSKALIDAGGRAVVTGSARGSDIISVCIGDICSFKSKIGSKKSKKQSNFNFFDIEKILTFFGRIFTKS